MVPLLFNPEDTAFMIPKRKRREIKRRWWHLWIMFWIWISIYGLFFSYSSLTCILWTKKQTVYKLWFFSFRVWHFSFFHYRIISVYISVMPKGPNSSQYLFSALSLAYRDFFKLILLCTVDDDISKFFAISHLLLRHSVSLFIPHHVTYMLLITIRLHLCSIYC